MRELIFLSVTQISAKPLLAFVRYIKCHLAVITYSMLPEQCDSCPGGFEKKRQTNKKAIC